MTTDPKEARWWHVQGTSVRCDLCPRACLLSEGEIGFCLARKDQGGRLVSLNYAEVTASQIDAVEKKPLFHFSPGASVLSLGTFGCMFDCRFCQNHIIARPSGPVPTRHLGPAEAVAEALSKGAKGIAFTYNEPIVWAEYILDVSREAHANALFVMLNTNGYLAEGATFDLLEGVDVLKVDIKGFDEPTYEELCDASLAPVLRTCRDALALGKHLELSYILIPGKTDGRQMLMDFADFVTKELSPDIAVHLFRFQPDRDMSKFVPADLPAMMEAKDLLMRSGLRYVYLGGDVGDESRDTKCKRCGAIIVSRTAEKTEPVLVHQERVSRFCPSYSNVKKHTVDGHCEKCGARSPIREL